MLFMMVANRKGSDRMVTTIKIGSGYVHSKHKEFLIDSTSDVAQLPGVTGPDACAPGSMAYTPDLNALYILGSDGIWHRAIDES
jgi:hypothetical protein